MEPISNTPPALYIHIPFCVSKCAYCDFYSLACRYEGDGAESLSNETADLQKRYTDALLRQMRLISERYGRPEISTVFIGGGTPSVLDLRHMEAILDGIKKHFRLSPEAEFTVEVNPDTVTAKKLSLYRSYGVNRLSIGMQSAVDSELKTISRIHSFEGVKTAVKTAREAGFENINLDIMYALPFQTVESFKTTLDAVLSLSPEHVSVYGLQLEEGTPLFNKKGSFTLPGEDAENAMNALALDVLQSNGYARYEISNYSKPGYECRHNLNYWSLGEYFGLGTAAHSFKDGKRYSVKKDIAAYCDSTDFSDVTVTEESLTRDECIDEYVMLSLRLCRGLSLKKLSCLTEKAEEYVKRAGPFIRGGFMELYNENGSENVFLRFTPKGFNVSNTILSEILCF